MLYSISILSSKDKIKDVKKINNLDCNYLHIDVADGIFVHSTSFNISEIKKIGSISTKKLDVHLMVNNPSNYIKKISLLNIEYITFHIEIKKDIVKIINEIKSYGIKCGLAINPNTNINELIEYLQYIDMVLFMSVEPGYGGQSFINITNKINDLNNIIKERNLNIVIEVDGGINKDNINILKDNNVDIAVIGSYIINSDNFKEQLDTLK